MLRYKNCEEEDKKKVRNQDQSELNKSSLPALQQLSPSKTTQQSPKVSVSVQAKQPRQII